MTKIFYDLETTGLNERAHGIHQISGYVEIDNDIVETFNFKVAPNPKAKIEKEALTKCSVTEEQIKAYPEMKIVFKQFTTMLDKYCNKYEKTDKLWLVGFNNRKFDDIFLRCWFDQNENDFFPSYFWPDSLDVLVLASQYLLDRRNQMPSFKLARVAKTLGFGVKDDALHDAMYDIYLTRLIYRVVTGLDTEPSLLL